MGGYGSGRPNGYKTTTDNYHEIDIRYLQKHDLLKAGISYTLSWERRNETTGSITIRPKDNLVMLDYRLRDNDGEWESQSYPVTVEWTPCNYGGGRAWFRCPASGCNRRVAILYGGSIFACRHCYRLS